MKPKFFSAVAIGQQFYFEGAWWQRVADDGHWNAMSGTRWGQFEDDEVVQIVSDSVTATDAVIIRYE